MPKTTKKTSKDVVNAMWVLDDANTVHALSYFPFFIGPVAMYFLWKSDKDKALHHIKYALLMAVAVLVLFMILNPFIARVVTLVYLWASGYFAFKAYNGEDVKVEIFDSVEDKISKSMKK